MAHKAKLAALEQRHQPSDAPTGRTNVTKLPVPAIQAPQRPLEVEWLDIFPDLHRCVAGRLNKTLGMGIFREAAIGMDRPPIGHAILAEGAWLGKVRRKDSVVWISAPMFSLEDAKMAVEGYLAGCPEIISERLAEAA